MNIQIWIWIKNHIWDFFQTLHLSYIKLASKYCRKTENYREKSTVLCMKCVCLFFQLTVVIMNGHFHEKLISFRLFHLPKQFDVCSFWELIGSLLSVCGRQRPERKKDLYLFKVSLAFEILKQWGNAIVFRHTVQKRQWSFQFKYWRYT